VDVLTKIKNLFFAGNELVVAFNDYLAMEFGRTFQVAVGWVLIGLLLVIVLRTFKFSFDVLRYVLVPSVIIAGLVTVVSSLSFLYVMPLAMGAGTVVMLFKS
jgi:hypothetical protein